MVRPLTKKQRVFIDRKADGATGVAAVLNNYNTTDYDTAKSIATENLSKPYIIDELRKLGFDSSNAKRVVGQILNDENAKHQDRLSAADKVFKVNSDYAPEKHAVLTAEVPIAGDINMEELVQEAELLLKSKKLHGKAD